MGLEHALTDSCVCAPPVQAMRPVDINNLRTGVLCDSICVTFTCVLARSFVRSTTHAYVRVNAAQRRASLGYRQACRQKRAPRFCTNAEHEELARTMSSLASSTLSSSTSEAPVFLPCAL